MRPTPADREIYFVQAEINGLIKIGCTDNAAKRLRGLSLESPVPLTALGVMICRNFGRTEAGLHAQFAHLRRHGEWFAPGPDLLFYIECHGRRTPTRLRRLTAALTMPTLPRGRPNKARAEQIAHVSAKLTIKTVPWQRLVLTG